MRRQSCSRTKDATQMEVKGKSRQRAAGYDCHTQITSKVSRGCGKGLVSRRDNDLPSFRLCADPIRYGRMMYPYLPIHLRFLHIDCCPAHTQTYRGEDWTGRNKGWTGWTQSTRRRRRRVVLGLLEVTLSLVIHSMRLPFLSAPPSTHSDSPRRLPAQSAPHWSYSNNYPCYSATD